MSTTLDGDGVDFVGLRPLLQRLDAVLQGQEKEARPRRGIWMLQRYRKSIDKYNINYIVSVSVLVLVLALVLVLVLVSVSVLVLVLVLVLVSVSVLVLVLVLV